MSGEHIYISPSMVIGKHEWRMYVTPSRYSPTDINNEYQWRLAGSTQWRQDREWPAYNPNDTYNGLPRTLRLLWEREKPNIDEARGIVRPPDPQQRLL